MARPRTFDLDEAVGRAMDLFWRRGYEATSTQDVLDHLGIARGSLYKAFGSKERLYALALDRYCAGQAADLAARLEHADPVLPVLRAVLLEMVGADQDDPGRGCLLVKAATERPDHPETAQRVERTLRRLESAIAGALERAQARGDLAPAKDPRALARFLTTFVQGLRVMGTVGADRAVLTSSVQVALSTLE